MIEIATAALREFEANSAIELIAVALAIAYLILAVKQNIACWYAAFISTSLFLFVFWQVQLYMESGLQVFYLVMAVSGWWLWQKPTDDSVTQNKRRPVRTWRINQHIAAIVFIAAATLVSGYLLADTSQRLPYLDSFTTWASVLTTIMVARKILENWIYWFVIDTVSIYLYLDRELYFTAGLFALYLVIICFGYRSWRQDYIATQLA